MINFEALSMEEIQELQNIIGKNVEKSELERSYLYTHDTIEKAKIYIWCFRFLYSIRNLTKEGNLKEILNQELQKNNDTYIKIANLLHKVEKGFFNRHKNLDKLRTIILIEDEVDDMIDAFAVLLEKSSVLSISRLKGIILEGQSGKDFKRLINDAKVEEKSEFEITEDFPQSEIEPMEEEDNSDGFSMVEEKLEEPQEQLIEPEQKESSFDIKDYIGEGVLPEEYQEQTPEDYSDATDDDMIDNYFSEQKEEHHEVHKKQKEDIEDREDRE